MIISVHQYLDHAMNILLDKRNENATVDVRGPLRLPHRENREIVFFRAKVTFESGHILDISDDFLIASSSDEWERNFAYFFGMPRGGETERIFLFDTHGLYGAEAHLDLGDDEKFSAGDPRLHGFEPDNIDIMDICRFIDLYFAGQPFPWDAQ